MRAKAIAPILAAAIAVLALPGLAAARAPQHRAASVSVEVEAQGTHGVRLELLAGEGAAALLASKQLAGTKAGKFGVQDVDYVFAPHPRHPAFKGALNLRVGRLGHFRGRFVPTSTKTQKLPARCTGEPKTIEKGFFVGSFDFRGERGYTSLHTHRERGTVTRRGAARCSAPKRHRHRRPPRHTKAEQESSEDAVSLLAAELGGAIGFQAGRGEVGKRGRSLTFFSASTNFETVGDYSVFRLALGFEMGPDAAAAFQTPNLAEPLAEATLTPPAPFSGSATFHLDDPRTASWNGDLAVELLGLGAVPLTGEAIYARMCKGRSTCTKTLPKELERELEAGGLGGLLGGAFVPELTIIS